MDFVIPFISTCALAANCIDLKGHWQGTITDGNGQITSIEVNLTKVIKRAEHDYTFTGGMSWKITRIFISIPKAQIALMMTNTIVNGDTVLVIDSDSFDNYKISVEGVIDDSLITEGTLLHTFAQ